jgi:hypothetical protein
MKLNQEELSEIAWLLHREIEEMREGWQLAGIGEADRLEVIKEKIEKELTK